MTEEPLSHTVTVDATGLQETAPVTNEDDDFADTPTSLDITRETSSTPLYARVTARLEPAGPTFDGVPWVWYPDDVPPWNLNIPSAEAVRYFRRSFTLEELPAAAELLFTADNLATVYVNGVKVGRSDDGFDGDPSHSWEYAPVFDVADALTTGENVVAIKVERFGNYGGLLARLLFDDGRTIDTDANWRAAKDVADGWTSTGFDDSSWVAAAELGEYGMDPWGTNVEIASEGAVRVALTDSSGDATEYTDTATVSDGTGIRTTGWARVPSGFDDGTARLQVSNARVTVATLELAVRNDI